MYLNPTYNINREREALSIPAHPTNNGAQNRMFAAFQATLNQLHKFRKTKDFGPTETAESLWAKLPKESQAYWINQASYSSSRS